MNKLFLIFIIDKYTIFIITNITTSMFRKFTFHLIKTTIWIHKKKVYPRSLWTVGKGTYHRLITGYPQQYFWSFVFRNNLIIIILFVVGRQYHNLLSDCLGEFHNHHLRYKVLMPLQVTMSFPNTHLIIISSFLVYIIPYG